MSVLSHIGAALLLLSQFAWGQPARNFSLGTTTVPWQTGGRGHDPVVVLNPHSGLIDTTNAPGAAIDFEHRPGWITPLFFDGEENIASRVLVAGSVQAPNAGRGHDAELEGIVDGDHLVAFELKPTLFEPEVVTQGIWVILDFAVPVGVQRIRFYPRNTVVATPSTPFHNDFLRAYELWVNNTYDSPETPDALIGRDTENEEPVVDVELPTRYARFIKIKSLTDVPFEIDEVEVYGSGYLQEGTYLSDLIDLGDRATVGPVRWREEAIGEAKFSRLSVRVRTGDDDSPIVYQKIAGREPTVIEEVSPEEFFQLERIDRASLEEDTEHWSPWYVAANDQSIAAPGPRRYLQFRVDFSGGLFTTRALDQLEFDYLQPPIADTLIAEVFPRLAEAEKPATFRYAVRLGSAGPIRGFDRLEIDTGSEVAQIRQMKLDGEPIDFAVEESTGEMFALSFPRISHHGALLEFTFDLPIFRFGSTFSGRAFDSRYPDVPQLLEPGNAIRFEPADEDELSGLAVAIPKPQIGKLVGEIALNPRIFTPNGDGVNDHLTLFFNVLQLTEATPVRFELFDLAGRRVCTPFAGERRIGPLQLEWDGRRQDGRLLPPGTYIWVLRVQADAFEEVHTGTLGIAY